MIVDTLWQQWTQEKAYRERHEAEWARLDERRERMRARLDDLPAAARGRDLLAADLAEAIAAAGADWHTSNAALKRLERAARLLRMTDQALVELEAAKSWRGVRQYLVTYLMGAHFRAIDEEDQQTHDERRLGEIEVQLHESHELSLFDQEIAGQ